MAGDWIKFELSTLDKPEVISMADMLGTTTYDVVGRLLRVWGWFDQQTQNGNAHSVTGDVLKRYIDALVGSQGFAATMQSVGWLNDDGMPNFDIHNGKSSKKRALTNNRVKRSRNASSVTEALPEKRREEVKDIARTAKVTQLPKQPPQPLPDWIPVDAWEKFVAMRKGMRAPLTSHGCDIAVQHLEKMRKEGHDIRAVLEQSVMRSWRGLFPPSDSGKGAQPPKHDEFAGCL